jgi:hypothetical protein
MCLVEFRFSVARGYNLPLQYVSKNIEKMSYIRGQADI